MIRYSPLVGWLSLLVFAVGSPTAQATDPVPSLTVPQNGCVALTQGNYFKTLHYKAEMQTDGNFCVSTLTPEGYPHKWHPQRHWTTIEGWVSATKSAFSAYGTPYQVQDTQNYVLKVASDGAVYIEPYLARGQNAYPYTYPSYFLFYPTDDQKAAVRHATSVQNHVTLTLNDRDGCLHLSNDQNGANHINFRLWPGPNAQPDRTTFNKALAEAVNPSPASSGGNLNIKNNLPYSVSYSLYTNATDSDSAPVYTVTGNGGTATISAANLSNAVIYFFREGGGSNYMKVSTLLNSTASSTSSATTALVMDSLGNYDVTLTNTNVYTPAPPDPGNPFQTGTASNAAAIIDSNINYKMITIPNASNGSQSGSAQIQAIDSSRQYVNKMW